MARVAQRFEVAIPAADGAALGSYLYQVALVVLAAVAHGYAVVHVYGLGGPASIPAAATPGFGAEDD